MSKSSSNNIFDTAKSILLREESDKVDVVTLDIPLLLRVLEYAKEDAKTDMDLHHLTDNLIKLSKKNDVLTMKHYEDLVP
jgi:hypothetical protein